MSTGFPASSLVPASMGPSATRMRWSSRYVAAEKNALWRLWPTAKVLLRSAAASCARPLLRRQTRVLGVFDPPGLVQAVRRREARGIGVVGGQPALHQAVRLLRWEKVPGEHRASDRRGTAPRLGNCQGT